MTRRNLSKLKKKIEKLVDLDRKMDNLSTEINELLEGAAEFEIEITIVGGDGILFLHSDHSNVSKCAPCLKELEEKGIITEKTFYNNSL